MRIERVDLAPDGTSSSGRIIAKEGEQVIH